ncbi:MAG: hypothetical protein KBC22_00890 [Candidatus Pacebacteria bacterium]|nr:hypothetical protein [Candidatus Paceibacterota bacterium]
MKKIVSKVLEICFASEVLFVVTLLAIGVTFIALVVFFDRRKQKRMNRSRYYKR